MAVSSTNPLTLGVASADGIAGKSAITSARTIPALPHALLFTPHLPRDLQERVAGSRTEWPHGGHRFSNDSGQALAGSGADSYAAARSVGIRHRRGVELNLPRITVVTPSFNQARFFTATMESIHGQGYPNLEHIVIDGGSTDRSVEIIRDYADRIAFWVSEPDKGQTDALIKGFSHATGDILCWLNSDDLFEPWTLTEVAEWFMSHPEDEFVYGDATWIDSEGRVIKPKREHRFNRFVWLYDHNFIPQPSSFWTRELYDRVGGLDAGFDLAMDADLWIRFAEHTSPRHVRRPWSRMRFYPEQKNTSMRGRSGMEGTAIRRRYLPPQSRRSLHWKRRAARVMRFALKLIAGGYPPSEIREHLGLIRNETWEMRQARRSVGFTSDDEPRGD